VVEYHIVARRVLRIAAALHIATEGQRADRRHAGLTADIAASQGQRSAEARDVQVAAGGRLQRAARTVLYADGIAGRANACAGDEIQIRRGERHATAVELRKAAVQHVEGRVAARIEPVHEQAAVVLRDIDVLLRAR